jgi:hypothetical protein
MDSLGRQADTVQLLTGGNSRVANFVKGLFGPPENPGANRAQVFDRVAKSNVSADDWGARYLTWMALGGTNARIPSPVLQIVGRTDVAGATRNGVLLDQSQLNGNMLAAAESACGWLVLRGQSAQGSRKLDFSHATNYFGVAPDEPIYSLIQTNGESELWQRLCSIENPPPVRGILVDAKEGSSATLSNANFYDPAKYPANARVGNHRGKIVTANAGGQLGIASSNLAPWCIKNQGDADKIGRFRESHKIDGELPPMCPPEIDGQTGLDDDQKGLWARRGAINAGFAVFSYLDQVTHGKVLGVRYNECELLKK